MNSTTSPGAGRPRTASTGQRKGRPTRAEARALHAEILDAAADLFIDEGFSTTMDKIAARARVSKRTLYSRYPSKPELYEAALIWLSGDMVNPIAIMNPELPLPDVLMHFTMSLYDLYTRPRVAAFTRLMMIEATRFPEAYAAGLLQFDRNVMEPLRTLLNQQPDIREPALLAHIVCNTAVMEIGNMHARGETENVAGFRELMRGTIRMLLHGAIGKEGSG